MGFNAKSWSSDLDDLGYPHYRKPPYQEIIVPYFEGCLVKGM